ncbi:hypothetical protein GQ43DRAFT_472126 [Delitschia confertaspora ATCC 74209]|uniref:DUF8035 domain-containing protein n=1 Tax=Delitschia confertaspora ATCC 74209 TaxID=1513339 RepID=A0A9P4JKD9_9PLEO|nr:hypothetical protein GQ43DRAFT_472126 [Delitschia confertaspora ATCC 74209]
MYRASTGDLSFIDDEPPRRPERWDRDKFERVSRRSGRDRDEHDHFHFEEHDRMGKNRRDIEIDDRFDRRPASIDRRPPPTRVVERERFYEDDRSERSGRSERPRRQQRDLFDEPDPAEIANRALAPYRRKSIVERDLDVAVRRPAPPRPQYLRRTSSLDTFDRRPMPRRREKERDEYRVPANVPIPLPIRERRRSPSRRRFHEEDYEEIHYREPEPRDDYSEIEVRRTRSTRRSKSKKPKSRAPSTSSSSASSFEEVSAPQPVGKKGKTRMPKRLVKKQAVIELGFPFEEEDDFIIVRRALEKEQIDEIIRISENYKEEKTTYVYEEKQEYAPPPPPPPPPQLPSVTEEVHKVIYQTMQPTQPPPPPQSVHYAQSQYAQSQYAQSVRSASPPRHESYEERLEESNHIGGPLTLLVPERKPLERRVVRDRDVKEEIRALENERRMLKYEREDDYEIIEKREPRRDVVRIEKDRKGRLALVRSAH